MLVNGGDITSSSATVNLFAASANTTLNVQTTSGSVSNLAFGNAADADVLTVNSTTAGGLKITNLNTDTTGATAICRNTAGFISTCGAGSTVTGTGAAGRVTFWTSNSNISSNGNFLWDNTTGSLSLALTGDKPAGNGSTAADAILTATGGAGQDNVGGTAGAGGAISLTGGAGGAATITGAGGAGGALNFTSGAAGASASGGANGGNITLQTGAGSGSGTYGTAQINTSNGSTSIGNTTTGTAINLLVGTGNFSLDGATNSTYALGASTTTGTLTVGGTAQTGNLTFGSSSGTNSVLIGNGAGATTVNISNANTAGAVNVGTAFTTGTISVGGTAQTGAINIGTGAGAGNRSVTVGSTANASTLLLQSGTGNLSIQTQGTGTLGIGTNAVAQNIAIGGTAANTITIGNTQTAGSISLGAAMTTGTVSLGGTGTTGNINLGQYTGTGTSNINIGNGNLGSGGVQNITIGNKAGDVTGTGRTALVLGSTNAASSVTINAGSGFINFNGVTTGGTTQLCLNGTALASCTGTGITGSGSNDQIAFFTGGGSSLAGDADLTFNGTNFVFGGGGTFNYSSTLTTGTFSTITANSLAPAAAATGTAQLLNVTTASGNSTGNAIVNGYSVAPAINTTGGPGTKELNSFNAAAPTLSCAGGGTCTYSALKVATAANSTAVVTQNGANITLGALTGASATNGVLVSPSGSFTAGSVTGLNIGALTDAGTTSSAISIGSGWDSILDSATLDISGTGAITGATGVTSSGTITFSGLAANRAVFTNGSSQLSSTGASADLLNSLSDETGTGVTVFGTSPTITTSLVAGTTTFTLLQAATTINQGAATGTTSFGNGGNYTLNTTSTGSLTIASGAGLTLNSGSNTITFDSSDTTLTASGLTTLTTAASLSATSTTTLTLGTGATLNSNGTSLNVQGDGAVDVNIAGGSAATGCTVANASGNLTCSGDVRVNGNDLLDSAGTTRISLGATNAITGALTVSSTASISDTLSVTKTIAINSGTTNNIADLTLDSPADTAGTNTHNGLNIDANIGNATAGTNTVNIINTEALTGDAQVSLNAVNIGALTGTAAAEYALNVGSGWDAALRVNGTDVVNGSGQVVAAQISGTLFQTNTDTASANNIDRGDTLLIQGGANNGIDVTHSADTMTVAFDPTEVEQPYLG